MIRLFTLLIKFCSSNISDPEWFSIESEKICIPSYKCPTCGAVGSCVDYHHPYQRDMIYHTHDGEPIREKVSITRVKCTSCGHTHALISGNLIPYGSYSIHFVLDVLMKYFLRVSTVEQICSSEGISHSTLYGWKKTFLKHKDKKQKAWNHECDSKLFSLISLGVSLMQLISLRVKPHAVLRPYEPLLRLPRSRRASRIPG